MLKTNCGFNDRNGYRGQDLLFLIGPTLHVRIGFDQKYRIGAEAPPILPKDLHRALVDTGALESCIDSALAKALRLPVIDRQYLSGVHGKQKSNIHLAQIYIPTLKCNIIGKFAGVHLSEGGQPHLALIGRTFLRNFTMVYDGETGSVTISK